MAGKPRNVQWKTVPDPTKKPRWAYDPSVGWRTQSVLWSFGSFDPFDWRDEHDRDEWCKLVESLSQFKDCEGRTWAQIEADRGRDHPVSVDRLIPEAQRRLEQVYQGTDELWRLRFGGRIRIWGVREERILRVLWWDPHHRICPSELKNT